MTSTDHAATIEHDPPTREPAGAPGWSAGASAADRSADEAVVADLAEAPLELLERELRSLASDLAAAEYRWLRIIRLYMDRRGHETWGCVTMAQWLSRYCALSPQAARDRVRVAAALFELPRTSGEFAAGRLSYSQVRAICRVADESTEDLFVGLARHATAEQLERIVSGYRRSRRLAPDPSTGQRPHNRRARPRHELVWWWEADGSLGIMGHLSPDDAEVFLAAIRQIDDAADALTQRETDVADPADECARDGDAADPSSDGSDAAADHPTRGERAAQALVIMAARSLDADPDRGGAGPDDRYVVTLTADVDGLARPAAEQACGPDHTPDPGRGAGLDPDPGPSTDLGPGIDPSPSDDLDLDPLAEASPLRWRLAELGSGRTVTAETARRVACDCTLHRILSIDGHPVDHASAGRVVPARVRRALRRRDQRCQFPGCDRCHRLHAHHIVHWVDHGPTQLSNLVLLCPYHHRSVHEGGYTIVGGHPGSPHPLGLAFRRPDGSIVPPTVPPPDGPPTHLARAEGNVTPHAYDRLDLAYTVGSLCDVIDGRHGSDPHVSAETPSPPAD